MNKFITVLCLCLLIPLISFAEDLYVLPSGTCTYNGNGTAATCAASAGAAGAYNGFSNISWGAGAGKVSAGDTLYLVAGQTYKEMLTISGGGSDATTRVTVSAPLSGTAIIDGEGTRKGITIAASVSYLTIDGVKGNAVGGDYDYGLVLQNIGVSNGIQCSAGGNTDIVIRKVEISGTESLLTVDGGAIYAHFGVSAPSIEIAYCWIHGPTGLGQRYRWAVSGIQVWGAQGGTGFSNTVVHHTKVNDIKIDAMKTGWNSSFYNNELVNNHAGTDSVLHNGLYYTCKVSHTSSVLNEPGVGVDWETYWSQSGSTGDVWEFGRNYDYGPHSDGIVIQSGGYTKIYNNYIHGVSSQYIYIDEVSNTSISNIYIYNNIIDVSDSSAVIAGIINLDLEKTNSALDGLYIYNNTILGGPYGVRYAVRGGNTNKLTNCIIKNNIFRTTNANTEGVNIPDFTVFANQNDLNNNLYFTSNATYPDVVSAGSTKYTVAELQALSPIQETNAVVATQATTIGSDYKPTPSSPAINAGADLSATFTTDKDGKYRQPGQWDIGAYEYIPPGMTISGSATVTLGGSGSIILGQ